MNTDSPIKALEILRAEDLFGSDGFFYTGVQDEMQKQTLSEQFDQVIILFIDMCGKQASHQQMLDLLRSTLGRFDRVSFDTEDAERLMGNFEKIMDCIGLESSDGALDDWMYGFDVS